jgi:hypothetical protein
MSIKDLAQQMSAQGRGPDDVLVHMSSKELASMQGLAEAAGGSLTINPTTGLPEAGFLDSMLPTILGFGATMIGGPIAGAAVGALTGGIQAKRNNQDPLIGAALGGLGGYGGGQMANALVGAGATSAAQTVGAQEASKQAANLMQGSLAGTGGVDPGFVNAMRPDMMLNASDAAKGAFASQPFYQQVGQGIQASLDKPTLLLDAMDGPSKAIRSAGIAAIPMAYQSMMGPTGQKDDERATPELPRFRYDPGMTGNYYGTGNDMGTYERTYFNPSFTRMAEGGEAKSDPARGMTGASADAMRYLMGQGARSNPNVNTGIAQVQAPVPVAARSEPLPEVTVSPFSSFIDRIKASNRPAPGGLLVADMMFKDSMNKRRAASSTPQYSFDPSTQQYTRMAEGGLASFAQGGHVKLNTGDFVIPADVTAFAGGGSTDAGMALLARKLGAEPIRGNGTGLSDDIPASIDGKQPARVANGEMVVRNPGPDGVKKLYAMMDRIRKQATGSTRQIRPVDIDKAVA